eukprot:1153981-Pelagomonas_calceolata.AAC.1
MSPICKELMPDPSATFGYGCPLMAFFHAWSGPVRLAHGCWEFCLNSWLLVNSGMKAVGVPAFPWAKARMQDMPAGQD